jgi:hypothetical protein
VPPDVHHGAEGVRHGPASILVLRG